MKIKKGLTIVDVYISQYIQFKPKEELHEKRIQI